MHVGERREARIGEHQPRRRGGLRGRQPLVQGQPVDGDRLARHGERRPAIGDQWQIPAALAARDAAIVAEQQPALDAGIAREGEQRAFGDEFVSW